MPKGRGFLGGTMKNYYRRYRGTAGATGVVSLIQYPDFSNGVDTLDAWLAVMGVNHIALQVEGLDGEVEFQGCNGDPDVAAEWYTIEALTVDGRIISNDDPVDFVRVNVTTYTSGTMSAMLTLEV